MEQLGDRDFWCQANKTSIEASSDQRSPVMQNPNVNSIYATNLNLCQIILISLLTPELKRMKE